MTLYLAPFIFLADISTHILTKRMTIIQDFPAPSGNISTHILTKRMTFSTLSLCNICSNISTHILTKRMTNPLILLITPLIFQLTSSRRGWPKVGRTQLLEQAFQLTSSRRGWRGFEAVSFMSNSFQLTSSRRGWHSRTIMLMSKKYFNSHPHEEDD